MSLTPASKVESGKPKADVTECVMSPPSTNCKTDRKAGDKNGRFWQEFRKFFGTAVGGGWLENCGMRTSRGANFSGRAWWRPGARTLEGPCAGLQRHEWVNRCE